MAIVSFSIFGTWCSCLAWTHVPGVNVLFMVCFEPRTQTRRQCTPHTTDQLLNTLYEQDVGAVLAALVAFFISLTVLYCYTKSTLLRWH